MGDIGGFVQGWQALTRHICPSELERARGLLEGVRPLLPRAPNRTAGVTQRPSLERVSRLFEGLRAPLERARSHGSFIDVWAVAGVRRKELPNAAVLAWLIDPRGSHGQGALCLTALVDLVDQRSPLDLSGIRLDTARVQTEERPLGSDRDRVDIVVDTPEILIFIEVKIDASEGQLQLSRYVESGARAAAARPRSNGSFTRRALTVFLSPRAPTEIVSDVVHITWRDLAMALSSASRSAPDIAGVLIHSFAVHVRSFGKV